MTPGGEQRPFGRRGAGPVAGRAGGGAPTVRRALPAPGIRLRNLALVGLLFLGLWPSLLVAPYAARIWRPAGVRAPSPHLVPPATIASLEPAGRPASADKPVIVPDAVVAKPKPPPVVSWPLPHLGETQVAAETEVLQAAFAQEVSGVMMPSRGLAESVAERALALMASADRAIETAQLVLVVDRNPAVERLYLMLARPGGAEAWRALGSVHVSTGQAGRKDYYITPVGVFAHTGAILDFRAQGTYNEHHVRGLGLSGMRVWDFGWQWALKGWHTDGEGGDIRLQMHATDPDLLERRLGRPASEGCVRLSSTMNRFLDRHGVLDADYEHEAAQDARYRALLAPDRTPTPLAGRLLVVIDSGLGIDAPPTSASRPPDWPAPAPLVDTASVAHPAKTF